MKLADLFEAPLKPEQEPSFLKSLDQEWAKVDYDRSSVIKKLRKYDKSIKLGGEGAFSDVYTKPRGKTAVKITRHDDHSAADYIKWAMKNQNNPHVPKIYSFKYNKVRGLFYVRMESLKTLYVDKRDWTKNDLPFLLMMDVQAEDLYEKGVPHQVYAKLLGYKSVEEIPAALTRGAKQSTDGGYGAQFLFNAKTLNKFMKIPNTLVATINKVRRLGGGTIDMALFDNVGHNIMVRPSTDELVITDPLS